MKTPYFTRKMLQEQTTFKKEVTEEKIDPNFGARDVGGPKDGASTTTSGSSQTPGAADKGNNFHKKGAGTSTAQADVASVHAKQMEDNAHATSKQPVTDHKKASEAHQAAADAHSDASKKQIAANGGMPNEKSNYHDKQASHHAGKAADHKAAAMKIDPNFGARPVDGPGTTQG